MKKLKRLLIEKFKDEFCTSHSGLVLEGLCLNRFISLVQRLAAVSSLAGGIAHADIVSSYIGLLWLGKSDYDAIAGFREDRFFKESVAFKTVPSEGTLSQRFEEHAERFWAIVNYCVTEFIKRSGALLTSLATGHVPLDIYVFIMDNSKTKKEGVPRTYQGFDGYSPIAAYLAMEGWLMEVKLREGSQHGQKGFIPFLAQDLHKVLELMATPTPCALRFGP